MKAQVLALIDGDRDRGEGLTAWDGFLKFSSEDEADEAVSNIGGREVEGHLLQAVRYFKKSVPDPGELPAVHVVNFVISMVTCAAHPPRIGV